MTDNGDRRPGKSAGCIVLALSSKRILYQLRHPRDNRKHNYGFWGGREAEGELPVETVRREVTEELGLLPDFLGGIKPIHVNPPDKWKPNKFEYATFIGVVAREFAPQTIKRGESAGYLWCDWDVIPYPLLPTPRRMLENPRIMNKIRRYVWAMEKDFDDADAGGGKGISSGDVL